MGRPGRGDRRGAVGAWRLGGLLLLLTTIGAGTAPPDEELVLRVGDVRTVDLPGGEPTRVTVVAGVHRTVTLLARSGHGDPRLGALDEHGALASEDDNGLAGWNSRLVLDTGGAEALACEVALGALEPGPVQLELRAGRVDAPVGAVQLEELALYHELLGEAAAERGELGAVQVAYFNAGQNWFNARAFAQARTALRRVLPESDAADPSVSEGSLLVCASLVFLGSAEAQLGRAGEAREHLQAGLARAVDLAHAPLQMLALNNLADLAHRQGERGRARELYAAAIELAVALGDEANELVLANAVAQLAAEEGDTDVARARLTANADRAGELGRTDTEAMNRLNLAELLRRRGEYTAARDELDRAWDLVTQREMRARILGERALLALETGRLDEADAPLREALALARDLGDPRLEIRCLQARARRGRLLGLHDDAERSLDEARALALEVEDAELRAELALDAATTAWITEAPREVMDRRLEEAREQLDGDLFPGLGSRLAATASAAAYDAGRFAEALDHAREQLRQAQLAGDATSVAVALSNQAHTLVALGDADAARPLVAQAVRRTRDAGHWAELVCALTVQTEVALSSGDLGLAAAALAEAERHIDAPAVRALPVEVASHLRAFVAYARTARLSQDLTAARIAAADDAAAREAAITEGFRDAGRWKARGLLEGIAEHRSGGRTPEVVALRKDVARQAADRGAIAARLARSLRDGLDDEAERARLDLAALDRELADSRAALAAAEPRDAGLVAPPQLDPAQVRGSLPPGTVLVEYAEGQDTLYAYVVHADGIAFLELGALEPLVDDVRSYVAGLADRDALHGLDDVARGGQRLHASLLAPTLAVGAAADAATLLVVPSPDLASLPFEALVLEHEPRLRDFSDVTFVLDRYQVSYGPSTPVLGLLADVGPRAAPGRMLLLADPLYGGEATPGPVRAPSPTPSPVLLPRLPATRIEALAIARLTSVDATETPSNERDLRWAAGQVELRTGREASFEALAEAPSGYGIVHVAAHGIAGTDPRSTGLALSATDGDGGHVSLHDVMELDLDAELAVLSACETARGAVRRGEGVQSLARAFMYAGARRVVASLWKVPDRSTAALMERFYEGHLTRGQAPVTALREARLALRRGALDLTAIEELERGETLGPRRTTDVAGEVPVGHPYTWAPFIHCGLPR